MGFAQTRYRSAWRAMRIGASPRRDEHRGRELLVVGLEAGEVEGARRGGGETREGEVADVEIVGALLARALEPGRSQVSSTSPVAAARARAPAGARAT